MTGIRPATGDDINAVLALWSHAAENASRPADTTDAVSALIERDPAALLAAAEQRLTLLGAGRFDAMVLDSNELGHRLWEGAGYARQDDWARWVKASTAAAAPARDAG